MVKDPLPQRGMKYNTKVHNKARKITEEEALEKQKEKVRRLAETLGWNDDWHKKPIQKDLNKKKAHKSRVKHSGHGK